MTLCNRSFALMYPKDIKGPVLGMRPFLAAENPLEKMKNAYYFMLMVLFVLMSFIFCPDFSGHVEKRFDKKAKVNFEIHDVADWQTNSFNTYIAQYLKK